MSSSSVDVTLATLPSDIIRNIFKCQGIFYGKLSVISQQWNILSLEHLQYLKLRNIKRLCWSGVYDFFSYNSQKSLLSIRISPVQCDYFGLDFMVNSTLPQDPKLVEVAEQWDYHIKKHFDLLHLNFVYCSRREQLQEIGQALHGVVVRELRISNLDHFNFEYMNSLLELLSSCLFKRLVLSPHNKSHFVGLAKTATLDFNDFYSKAATLVSSIQIGIIQTIRWNIESTKAEWEQLKIDYEELLSVNCRLEINDLKDQMFAPTKLDVRMHITPNVTLPAPSFDVASSIELNLSNLPSDVIRKIIRMGQESINDMMLISHRWNTLSAEHLCDRKNLPVINMVQWSIDNNEMSIVVVRLLRRWKKIFGVDKLPFLNAAGESNPEDVVDLSWNAQSAKFSNILAKIFGRCSSIDNLRLDIDANLRIMPDISMLKNAINDTSINMLTIYLHQHFNANHVSMLTELLQNNSPQRLVMTTSRFDIIYAFLADGVFGQIHSNIAALVPIIEFSIFEFKSRWSTEALMVAHWNIHKDNYRAKWQIDNGQIDIEKFVGENCRIRIIFDSKNDK